MLFELRYNTERDKIKDQQAAVEADRKKTQDMYNEWDNFGYATNKVALFFGVEPGTPSKEARQASLERSQELTDKASAYEQQLSLIEAQRKKEIEVLEAKEKSGLKNATYTEAAKLMAVTDAEGEKLYSDDSIIAYIELQDLTPEDKDAIIKSLNLKASEQGETEEEPQAIPTEVENKMKVLDEKLATMNDPEAMGYLIAETLETDEEIIAKLQEYGIKYENGKMSWISEE